MPLLEQLLSKLQGGGAGSAAPAAQPGGGAAPPGAGAGSPGGSGTEASLLKQLLPLLQQQLGATAPQSGSGSGSSDLVPLIKQLITELQGMGGSQGGGAAGAAAQTKGPGQTQGPSPNASPSMGISGAEVDAMLARSNGTGPEVQFSDYHTAAPGSAQLQGSLNAGGQVAGLGAQMGGEAA